MANSSRESIRSLALACIICSFGVLVGCDSGTKTTARKNGGPILTAPDNQGEGSPEQSDGVVSPPGVSDSDVDPRSESQIDDNTKANPSISPLPPADDPNDEFLGTDSPQFRRYNARPVSRSPQRTKNVGTKNTSSGAQSASGGFAGSARDEVANASPPMMAPSAPDRAASETNGNDPTADERQPAVVHKRTPEGLREIEVFYATDRMQKESTSHTSSTIKRGATFATIVLLMSAIVLLVFGRARVSVAIACVSGLVFLGFVWQANKKIVNQGVTYTGERGTFVRGFATVTIPKSHQRGQVERPSILRLEFSEDQEKHVVLTDAFEVEPNDFYRRMHHSLDQTRNKELLVFIHGFNVDFDSALRRTAQIAADLSLDGAPVCYSWPSQGSIVGYTVDENNIQWTVPHLKDFLIELAENSQARTINIVAHSMGNRGMTQALKEISYEVAAEHLPIFDEVVMAAPDVDADRFRKDLAPRLTNVATHVTLYASSDDRALIASKKLHGGYPRAGESGENLVVIPNVETIDVSGIDLSLLGHSYYGNSESILRDLYEVVRNRLRAHERSGLVSRKLRDFTYWSLRTARISANRPSSLK